jgi:hypothetical protein
VILIDPRRGSAIAVVTIVLLIVASLGATFLYTSRGAYRATAQAAYRLRLQIFMVSALDEARARLFQLTTPGARGLVIPDAGLRDMILEKIPSPEEPLEAGSQDHVDSPPDLSVVNFKVPLDLYNGQDVLWASQAIAFADVPEGASEAGEVQILEAQARIHGFQQIWYEDSGGFPKVTDYYQQIDPFKDSQTFHRDYTGYCTITIHARLKTKQLSLERKIQVTHDIKVTDLRPPARDFVLFSYHPTVGDKERIFDALNKGGHNDTGPFDPKKPPTGRLVLYPNGIGRVYIRGPYVMLTEGHTDGLGGKAPKSGPSYPQGGYPDWGGFSQVPGPRGIVLPARFDLAGWETIPSPIRPEKGCTSDYSDGSSQVGLPVFSNAMDLLKSGDSAGFGQSGFILSSSFGPNKQRFYLTGEPQCMDMGLDDCRIDGFRGVMLHDLNSVPTEEEGKKSESGGEAEEAPLMEQWSPQPDQATGTWDLGTVRDMDRLLIESGPFELGLYSPVKFYPFIAGQNCDKTAVNWSNGIWNGIVTTAKRTGEEIGDFVDGAGEIITLGAFTSEGYTRRWKKGDNPGVGLAWNPDRAALEELSKKPLGNPLRAYTEEDKDFDKYLNSLEPDIALMPYALYYQKPKNQGWLNTWITTGIDGALTLLMFVPGPGIVANLGLRGAMGVGSVASKRMAASLFAKSQATLGTKILTDLGASLTIDRAVVGGAIGAGYNKFGPEQTDPMAGNESTGLSTVTSGEYRAELERIKKENQARDAQALVNNLQSVEGEVTPADRQKATEAVDQIGTLDKILTAYAEMDRRWKAGIPEFDALMSGNPPTESPALDELRNYEAFGDYDTVDWNQVQYVGFLPPGLKPYQRLATRWHGGIEEIVEDNGGLWLEGVLALDHYPQEDKPFEKDITYKGIGALISTAGADANDPNQHPAFKGKIVPENKELDYLTLAYWTQIGPDKARNKDGLGMLSLGGSEVWASVVGPYGARPTSAETVIRGNMVTGYVDRHRYPDSANLKLVYRYESLRPDLAADGASRKVKSIYEESEIRRWQHVSVSPKVAGWYDSVE